MSRPRLVAAALVAVLALSAALAPAPAGAAESLHVSGTTANGDWVLDVPAAFNGTVLVWSHGYTFTPVQGASAPTNVVRDSLLADGYALVGSSYAGGGTGWAVHDGVRAGLEAITIAERRIGAERVERVFAWGNSLGGLITQMIAEQHPDLVDGVAPLCGVLGGTNRNLDLALDVAVGVKRFFHPALRLRGFASREGAQANFDAASAAVTARLTNPATQASSTGRVLGLAALMGSAAKTKTFSGTSTASAVAAATESVLTALNYATVGRYDIEQRVGGNPSTNVGTDYLARVNPQTTARFTAFGFGAGLLRSYATSLQTYGKRIGADPEARRAAGRLGNPTGALADRTVTMHTVHDPLVIVQNERVFLRRVTARGATDRLLQLYVQPPAYVTAAPYGAGHCNFASDQYVAVIRALDGWVASGNRPDAATLGQLFAAHPGALDLDYKPALWPAR